MVVDLPRRWRWAIGLACAFAVALGLLFVVAARPVDVVVARAAPAIVETATLAASPVPQAPAPAAFRAHGADEIQVCGGAWLKAEADGSFDAADLERATRFPQARQRTLAALRSNADEFARAAALWLEMFGTDREQRLAALGAHVNCAATECETSPGAVIGAARARDALARLAASSRDPQVYALAFKVCSGKRSAQEGACQLISAEQWARLDPGNASPWLFMLASAKARNDTAAQNDALYRIASAQRSDLGFFKVAGVILDAAPDDEDSKLATRAIAVEAIGFEAAVTLPDYQPLTAACRGEALADPNRRQTCAAIADVLAERSDTLIDRAIGAAIGRQVGWPVERNERMRGEYAGYTESLSPAPSERPDLGCRAIQREIDVVRRRAALGETGALREWVAQSGKKPEDFIREQRARQRAQDAAQYRAEQPASAAAASAATSSPH